jgi:tRNA pseudouridine-54 N-methylase
VRIHGGSAKFLRPDERSLAILVQKTLAAAPDTLGADFVELRPGIALARGDLDCVLADLNGAALYVLAEGAPDIRGASVREDAAYFIGDHAGFAAGDVERLQSLGATALSIGPISLHSDDVVAVLSNELARLAGSSASL